MRWSVAERRRALVANPVPQRHRALYLGAAYELSVVEFLGVEADRADVVATARGFVSLHQFGQRRASVARHADCDTLDGEADSFLGEENERRPPVLRGADGDEERDGHLL